MPVPLLYDAVTLRHFAACGRLYICEELHASLPMPRWSEEVFNEIRRASFNGAAECSPILAATWLGSPVIPNPAELRAIYHIQVELDFGRQPPLAHAGEAQSIYFAQKYGGVFATDDNTAYDFAERRFGYARVVDTVQILREAVVAGHLSRRGAAEFIKTLRADDRHIRRVHPDPMSASDF